MVYYLVLFNSLVASISGFWVSSHEFIVDFNVLSCVLKDIINVQDHDEFLFGITSIKELMRIQINSECEKVTKNKNDTLEEFAVWHVLKVLMHPRLLAVNLLHVVLNMVCESP